MKLTEKVKTRPLPLPKRKKVVVKHKHVVPEIARKWGFFYRVRAANNSTYIRLLSHNKSPKRLEQFLAATTGKWLCYDKEGEEIHCEQCPLRQQRECAIWALARTVSFWKQLYGIKSLSKTFQEPEAARKARYGLFILWLHLRRVYKIPQSQIEKEAVAMCKSRGRR